MLNNKEEERKMNKVIFIKNDGADYGEELSCNDGLTLGSLLAEKQINLSNYTVRVNHEEVMAGYVIQDNDRVSIMPTKVAGA